MAKVIGQSIPPSLAGGYGDVMTSGAGDANSRGVCGLNNTVRGAKEKSTGNAILRLRREAATWLRDNWAPAYPSSFYKERLEEIRNYDFDERYWYQVLPTRDRTEYGVPFVAANEGPFNMQYDDPLRRQTNCIFDQWSKYYATPLGDGTLSEPAPGWQGEVQNYYFRDLWFAQRRLTFFLPVLINEGDKRPVLIDLQSTIKAVASFRVNHAWYARCLWTYFFSEGLQELPSKNFLITKWKQSDIYPMDLISLYEDSWECTNNLRVLRNAYSNDNFHGFINCNRLGIVVTSPPSRGVYFARNDDVMVSHHETVTLYIGKGPYG
jgi:hypothetical protein